MSARRTRVSMNIIASQGLLLIVVFLSLEWFMDKTRNPKDKDK